ncbi:MAG: lysylphosphatidylglycerol synthase domain-containing protein, partial [Sulfolobales archaeon]|nr:lysylphosphatidylglycerol synthase domain-containing protein [Sulfolobales archaeon]
YALSVDLAQALSYASEVPAHLLALSLAARSLGPLLHSAQFYVVVRSHGYDLGFRRVLLGMYSALALEYVVPVGGATEVGKVAFLAHEGVPLSSAVKITFLHRLAHSVFVAVELALLALLARKIDGLFLWLLTATAVVNALNLAAVASTRFPRFSKPLLKYASKLGYREVEPADIGIPARKTFSTILLAIGLEKAASVVSGYLILSHLDRSASLVHSLIIFDILLVTFWLLPVVTPAGVGQVEVAQLLASASLDLNASSALSAIILYRLVTTASTIPQLIPALIKYGANLVGRIE